MYSNSKNIFKVVFSIFFSLLICFVSENALATHNRAGQITYERITDLKFKIILTTYTEVASSAADRPQVEMFFGDGQSDVVERKSQTILEGYEYVFQNIYEAEHTYPGHGVYLIQFTDPNRIAEIKNMTNSVNQQFYIESELQIDRFIGSNNSPQLLHHPIDKAKVNVKFIHNPAAFDISGDSLHFSIIPPKQDKNEDVDGFFIPSASNYISINPNTGELVWDAPTEVGVYNIAILVREFRYGTQIGYIIRDMQIIVEDTDNNPPEIEPIQDTCVVAGTNPVISIDVKATDPDAGQTVKLIAKGGPMIHPFEPAILIPEAPEGIEKVEARFHWAVKCEHIRKRPYQVVFKAIDNHFKSPLIDKKSFFIEVIGPEPQNPTANPLGNGIELEWELPFCSDQVAGYYIYRRADSSHWNPSYCETGVPASQNFQKIATIQNKETLYYYDDNDGKGLAPGVSYCYRITAVFRGMGQYEVAEGIASFEVCAELIKDIPVVTHVDVRNTDPNNGSIFYGWSKPDAIDTIQNPGPYKYELYRSDGSFTGDNPELIAVFTSDYFAHLNDSSFIDSLINTQNKPFSYELQFYATVQGSYHHVGNTQIASSIYLSTNPAYKSVELQWEENIPWNNQEYLVYRFNDTTQIFDSITRVSEPNYIDTGLIIGKYYCYYVKALGTYSVPGYIDPLINRSQEICERAIDTIPPCPPELISANAFCDLKQSELEWVFENTSCDSLVESYNIYFTDSRNGKLIKVNEKYGFEPWRAIDDREELRKSMAGCYAVSAIDIYGNESKLSNVKCVDNCPKYELPNIFSPNDDMVNDLYIPLHGYRFIESVHFRVFNRWGSLVFETNDPAINWDGTDMKNKQELEAGAYFYICTINENYLDGIESRTIHGTVQIVR